MTDTDSIGRLGAWVWALPPKPSEIARYARNATPLSVGIWVIVAAGAALRWHAIGAESLWLDEIASYQFAVARYDSSLELVTTVPLTDPHPPLYYLLLRWWAELFGTSAVGLRSMSLFFGTLTILLTYLLTVKLFERRTTGLIAAGVVAASTMHVYFAQEARMYALLSVLTLASFYWYVDLVFAENPSRSSVARYVVATTLLAYAHTYAVFLVFAQTVFVLLRARRDVRSADDGRLRWLPRLRDSPLFRRWAVYQTALGVLIAPWLVILAGHALGLGFVDAGDTDWVPGRNVFFMFATFDQFLFYDVDDFDVPGQRYLIWVAIGLAVAALLRFTPDADPDDEVDEIEIDASDRSLMLATWLAVPILAPFAVSWLVKPIFVHKYTIGASLAFFVMIAHGARKIGDSYGEWVAYGVVVLLLIGVAAPAQTYYDGQQKNDWESATEPSNFEYDPLVVTAPTYMDGVLEYHTSGVNATVRSVPNDATWAGALSNATDGRHTVYLVATTWYTGEARDIYQLANTFAAGGYEFSERDVDWYPLGVTVFKLERTGANSEPTAGAESLAAHSDGSEPLAAHPGGSGSLDDRSLASDPVASGERRPPVSVASRAPTD